MRIQSNNITLQTC